MSKKEPKNDKPSSSSMNHLQSPFKMEAKVDIKLYQGEIDARTLNHWLYHLGVYFSVHDIEEEQNISFFS